MSYIRKAKAEPRRKSFWARSWPKLAQGRLIERADRVLAAVSGGPDSVCLAHFLLLRARKMGFTLALAHVNHGLRGADSAADERFVVELGKKLGLRVYTSKAPVRELMRSERRSLEDAARKLRYAELARLAKKEGFNKVAVGHHADDQAETFLLHLLRGVDAQGLAGMPERRSLGPKGPELVRPLLPLTRAEVLAYLAVHDLPYRKDKSNDDDALTRNWVRKKLLPLLETKNPRIREHLVLLARGVRELSE